MMKPLVLILTLMLVVDPVFAQMPGFLGNPASMYNQVGSPVAGAWQGNQMYNMGNGSQMMNQCPYQQQMYVDPTASDPGVVEARAALAEIDEKILTSKLDLREADQAVKHAKDDLAKSLTKNTNVEAFVRTMTSCESFTQKTSVTSLNAWEQTLDTSSSLNGHAAKAQCFSAAHVDQSGGTNFDAKDICLDVKAHIHYFPDPKLAAPPNSHASADVAEPMITASRAPAQVSDAPASSNNGVSTTKPPRVRRQKPDALPVSEPPPPQPSGPQVTVNPTAPTAVDYEDGINTDKLDVCQNAATALHEALDKQKRLKAEYDQAVKDRKERRDDISHAQREAQEDLAIKQERDQLQSERMTAQSTGVICQSCGQKPSVSTAGLVTAGVVTLGLGLLSYKLGRQAETDCTQMGYFNCGQMHGPNVATSFNSGLAGGLPIAAMAMGGGGGGGGYANYGQGSYGYPMASNGLYGTVPGGYTQGGIGCGQTINGSPFANQGIYGPGGGGYFPGGYQMPGMSQFGIPGAGGYNPYAQQMAMQQMYSDQQRAMYLASATAAQGYGIFQQDLSLAGGYLQGAGSMQPNYSLLGGQASTFGLNNYLGSTFASPYARQGCGGSPLFGGASTSFSICAGGSFGSSMPTTYGSPFSTYSNGAFGGSSFSGTGTFSR